MTHVYIDWLEIERHRQRGGYGFTSYVTPDLFAGWVAAGVLAALRSSEANRSSTVFVEGAARGSFEKPMEGSRQEKFRYAVGVTQHSPGSRRRTLGTADPKRREPSYDRF